MKDKKILLPIIFIITGILVLVIGLFVGNNLGKLKGDVNGSDAGISLSVNCDKTELSSNETTSCSLILATGSENIISFSGNISVDSNLELSNVTPNENLFQLVLDRNLNISSEEKLSGNVLLATFNVKAIGTSNGHIYITKGDNPYMMTSREVPGNYETVYLNDVDKSITIGGDTAQSDNANLTDLRVGLGASYRSLSPTFSSTHYEYTVNYSDDDKIQNQIIAEIEADKSDTNASVTGTGTVDLTNVSTKTVSVVVTAQNGTTKNTYSITFNKTSGKSTNNNLSSLKVCSSETTCNYTLTPTFSAGTISYSLVVPNEVSSVFIKAEKADTKATIEEGTGTKSLNVGSNTVNVKVKAENGSPKTYTINIERQDAIDPSKSSVNTLSTLSLAEAQISPKFNKDKNTYNASSDDILTAVTVNYTKTDPKSTVEVRGDKNLVPGTNIITVTVTAENNQKNVYTITFRNGKESGICKMELSSTVYQIDNVAMSVSGVDTNHNDVTILNNIKADCGSVTIKDGVITITYNGETKTYQVNRVFFAKTGNNVTKYSLIIGGLLVLIGAAMFILTKMKSNKE